MIILRVLGYFELYFFILSLTGDSCQSITIRSIQGSTIDERLQLHVFGTYTKRERDTNGNAIYQAYINGKNRLLVKDKFWKVSKFLNY